MVGGMILKFVVVTLVAYVTCYGAGGQPIGLISDLITSWGTSQGNLFTGLVVLLGILGNVIHESFGDGL